MKRYHTIEELGGFRRYMEKQVMMKHDIDLFLQELLDNKTKYDITNYKVELANKKVLFIEDSEKNRKWIDKIENSTLVLLESDHNFIDKRRELSGVIVNWLRSN